MADKNKKDEETFGYQYPEELEEAIGPITSIEDPEETRKRRTRDYIPIAPDTANKIKNYWDENGGDSYWLQPQNFVGKEFQEHVLREDAPKVVPKKLDEWIDFGPDGKTPSVDFETLRLVGIPQDVKTEALADVMQHTMGIAKKDLLTGNDIKIKPDDSATARIGKYFAQSIDQAAGTLGSSAYEHLKQGGRFKDIDLKTVMNNDENAAVLKALREGQDKVVLRGGAVVSLKDMAGLSPAQALDEAARQKIKYAWDMINDSTDLAITQDIGLVTNLLPVLGYLKAAAAAKAGAASATKLPKILGAASVVSNPLTTVAEKLAAKKGVELGLPALMGLSGVEGALMQRRHISDAAQEEELEARLKAGGLSAGLTAGVGIIGNAALKGYSAYSAGRQRIREKAATDVMKLVESIPEEDIQRMIAGELDFPSPAADKIEPFSAQVKAKVTEVPPIEADPVYRKEVKAAAITRIMDKDNDFQPDFRIIQETITQLPHNEKIQAIINMRRQQGYNESISEAKRRLALLNTLQQTEADVSKDLATLAKAHKVEMQDLDFAQRIGAASPTEYSAFLRQTEGKLPTDELARMEANRSAYSALSDVIHNEDAVSNIVKLTDQDFIAAIEKVAPQQSKAIAYQLGRISDQDLILREMVDIFRAAPPDKIKEVSSVNNSVSSRFLDAIQKWWENAPRSQKDVDVAIKRSEIVQGEALQQAATTHAYVSSLQDKVVKTFPTGIGVETGHKTVVNSLEGIRKAVEMAARNDTTVDPIFIAALTKDAKGILSPEDIDGIKASIIQFNQAQRKRIETNDITAQIIANRIYTGRAAEGIKRKPLSDEEVLLHRLTAGKSSKEIQDGFNQYFIQYARSANVPYEKLTELTSDFGTIANAIVRGKEIPSDVLMNYKLNVGKFLEEIKPNQSGRLRRFGDTLDHYNKEAHWVENVSTMIEHGFDDPLRYAPYIVPELGRIAEQVRSPNLLRRFELLKAAGHQIYMEAVKDIDLPGNVKNQMYEAQAGGLSAKLRLMNDPNFIFRTDTHITNVFKATKEWDKVLFNAMCEALETAGIKPDREFLLGYFLNPHNNFDKSGYLAKLAVDAIGAEKWAEKWSQIRKDSNKRLVNFQNTEFVMSSINHDLGYALLSEEQTMARGIKDAMRDISEKFKEENIVLIKNTAGEWAEPEFKYGFNKLQGSKGIAAVGNFFYGFDDVKGKPIITPLGRWHQWAFIKNNKRTLEHFRTQNKIAFAREANTFLRGYEGYTDPEVRNQAVDALWSYFNDAGGGSKSRTLKMDAKGWIKVWDYVDFQVKTLYKAYSIAKEIVEKKNADNPFGYKIPMPEWRKFYVYTPSKSRYDLDDFTDRLFRDVDITRHFGSSLTGQLQKAEGIILSGPSFDNMAHPAKIIYDYVHHNIASAHTIHSRTHLENAGMLMRDQGYTNHANWVMKLAQDRLRTPAIDQIMGGQSLIQQFESKLLSFRPTRAITLGLSNPIASLLGASKIFISLNKPINLVKNIVQASLETMMQQGLLKGAWTGTKTLFGSLRNIVNPNRKLPTTPFPFESIKREIIEADMRGEFIKFRDVSPGTHAAGMAVLRGLSDAYDRARLNTFQKITATVGETPIPRGKGFFTRRAVDLARGYDASIDLISKQFKERAEAAISRAHIDMAMRAHDAAIMEMYLDPVRGIHTAFKDLSEVIPLMPKNKLWGFLSEMKRGLENGNPHFMAEEFITAFHAERNGRFSPTASGVLPHLVSPIFPQAFMFANAKALRPFRYADLLRRIRYDLKTKSSSFTHAARNIPSQFQEQAYWSIVPAFGVVAMLDLLQFGGAVYLSDKAIEELEPGSWARRLVSGFGIPFSDWGPMPGFFREGWKFFTPNARGSNTIGVTAAAYHAMSGFMEVSKAIEDYFETNVPWVEGRLEQLENERKTLAEYEQLPEIQEKLRDIDLRILRHKKEIRETWLPKAVDYALANVPAFALLLDNGLITSLLHIPTVKAYIEREAKAQEALRIQTNLKALEDDAYTGPWSTAAYVLGATRGVRRFNLDKETVEQNFNRIKRDYLMLGESEENAEWLTKLVMSIADWMDDSDSIAVFGQNLYGQKDIWEKPRQKTREAWERLTTFEELPKREFLLPGEELESKEATIEESIRKKVPKSGK